MRSSSRHFINNFDALLSWDVRGQAEFVSICLPEMYFLMRNIYRIELHSCQKELYPHRQNLKQVEFIMLILKMFILKS